MLARQRLTSFLRGQEADFRESYLFRNNHVCGVKISTGAFVAKWYEGDSEIQFFRDQSPLGTVAIESDRANRAA
jgi:hypothetical protein